MQTTAAKAVHSTEGSVLRAQRREHTSMGSPVTGLTKEAILESCRANKVEFVDMQFVDIHGTLKAVTIPVHKLEDALDHNVWFDGSSIQGFTRIMEADMYLQPDLDTFAILPWTLEGEDVTARLICDVFLPSGEAFEGCPRRILKRQIEKAAELGLALNTGPELEFFLFKTDENGKPTTLAHDDAGYFDQTTDLGLRIRRHMTFALEHMGIEVEALHHEVAPGQHEINFKYADALRTADNAMTLKLALKAVAQRMGLHATFMPKPIFGENGSGMHVHLSLASLEDGRNTFYDQEGVYGLSKTANSFVAGIMKHIHGMNAIINPTVNSYKRLVVGYEAPVNIAWGQQNRSALIRVPRLTPAQAKRGARVELRCADPSANPYLAFAAMLAAGLDGVQQGMTAPTPMETNIWKLSSEEMAEKGIETVAPNLGAAIDALEANSVLVDALGGEFIDKYVAIKRREWDDYRIAVTDWEMDRYMGL